VWRRFHVHGSDKIEKSFQVTALLSKERWGATLGREQQKGERTSMWHRRKNMLKFNSPCVYYRVVKIGDDQVMKAKGIWNNRTQRVG